MTESTTPDEKLDAKLDEDEMALIDRPGARLAALREKRGHSMAYVASKLHLRVRVIELLEADAYDEMPEAVFIKGYLRAYANLLEVESAPLLELFNAFYLEEEGGTERTLWQSRRPINRTENWVRYGTGAFALLVIIAVFGWWVKNKDIESVFSAQVGTADTRKLAAETDIQLTDLSNMRSLLSPPQKSSVLETPDG
jgi:cytoskeleton protein RodZ